MTPTGDDFQALARSSPWRWTTLHFRHRSSFPGDCEAWVRRPGELLVVEPSGRQHRETGVPDPRSFVSSDPGFAPPTPAAPQDVEPVRRPDGLVAERPDAFEIEYDDPMWGNYTWVAMLDPVELSHDVDVADVRVGERAGRPTWEARLRPLAGYEPRCGCCSLLSSPVVDRAEWGDRFVERTYPDHHEVALDVQTGVVVRLHPVGGHEDAVRLENDILEVDA